VLLAAAVYAVTNPYVVRHLLLDPAVLSGNLDNSTAMYAIGRIGEGAWRVTQLMVESCTPPILLAGLIGLIMAARRHPRSTAIAAGPAIATLLIAVAIGAGKPAEYARFLLLPAALLAVCAGVALRRTFDLSKTGGAAAAIGVASAACFWPGGSLAYARNFAVDAWSRSETRWTAARWIEENVDRAETIGVPQYQEPAPYGTPPFDLAHRRVVLIPADQPTRLEMRALPRWIVASADDRSRLDGLWWAAHYRVAQRWPPGDYWISRITWANKPVFVFQRGGP
jgi:hypothetical protein